MARKSTIFNLKSPLLGFFDKAFSKRKKSICESAFDVGELIPFRLSKSNVIHLFKKLRNFVQIKSALVSDSVAIPSWGSIYPFAAITGASLNTPKAAAKGHEASYLERIYKDHKSEADVAIAKFVTSGKSIPLDAVIFQHQIEISSKVKKRRGTYGDPLRPRSDEAAKSVYAKISGQYLAQQVYDLDSSGNLVINPNKESGAIVRPVGYKTTRRFSKLVKIIPYDVSLACGISDVASCIDFFKNILPIINSGNIGTTPYGNPTYGKYDEYFRKLDCIGPDGKVDGNKFIGLLKSGDVKVTGISEGDVDFVRNFLMKYWMLSDYTKTYVWVPVTSARKPTVTENDIKIAEKSLVNESVSSVTEAGGGSIAGLTNDTGDVDADDWSSAFFKAMISSKQQSSRRVITFLTVGSGKTVVNLTPEQIARAKEISLSYGNVKYTREFIVIDGVLDDAQELDFRRIFADERFSGMLSKDAPRVFSCKKISGFIFGFPFNPELEEKHQNFIRTRQKSGSNEFYQSYLDTYGLDEGSSTGFYVTLMCPKGGGGNAENYFLFTGYDAPSNPRTEMGEPPIDISEYIPSDENNLLSVIWHNNPTQKSTGKIEMPTSSKVSKTNDAGTSIGYKSGEHVGDKDKV